MKMQIKYLIKGRKQKLIKLKMKKFKMNKIKISFKNKIIQLII